MQRVSREEGLQLHEDHRAEHLHAPHQSLSALLPLTLIRRDLRSCCEAIQRILILLISPASHFPVSSTPYVQLDAGARERTVETEMVRDDAHAA